MAAFREQGPIAQQREHACAHHEATNAKQTKEKSNRIRIL